MADLGEILRRHQASCPHCRASRVRQEEKRARWQREQEDGERAFEQMMRDRYQAAETNALAETVKAGARGLSDTVHYRAALARCALAFF